MFQKKMVISIFTLLVLAFTLAYLIYRDEVSPAESTEEEWATLHPPFNLIEEEQITSYPITQKIL